MARGYAVSFGLMAFSLYLFFKEENESSKMWSMQVATLAMIANFNLVYFWVSLGFLHFFWLLSSSQKNLKTLFMNYGFPLLSLVYLFIVFKRLSEAQQLYFGGKEGIVENVVNDQLWCFIYDNSYLYNETFLFIWQILPLAMLAIALAFTTNRKVRSNVLFQNWVKVLFVLLFSLLLIELNHRFTGSLYPIKRTGLFMSLLYGICFMLFIRFLSSIKPIQFVVLIFAYSFSAVLFFHTISSFDRMRFREIAYDSHHHEILDRLAHEVKDTNKELDLSANWQVGPSLNFYRKTKNLNWLPQINRDPVRRNAKYLLVFEDDLVNLNKDSLSPLLSYPEDGVYLFTHKTFE
jgi:hypothetical protein